MHRLALRRLVRYLPLLTAFMLVSCAHDTTDVIGQAYVAPATLNVRRQLTQKSNVAAVLKHGQHVSILDVRRRFVRIRADNGTEGWVDSSDLLSASDMDRIRHDRQHALTLPSEGSATVFEALNVHIDPNRQSPAFVQIPEGVPVTVLAHRLAPKISGPAPAPSLVIEKPQQPARKGRKERGGKNSLRLPPMPAPPKPPSNWQELSAERIPGSESTADLKAKKDADKQAKKVEQTQKPVPLENWTLVRTKGGDVGWVLSRNLIMSIPDEVAQYAEGKRITSYFDLGTVNDEEKGPKHNWLWTTSSGLEPFDFDSWRVFLWNRRRHRYETSYRERDLEGYFPVHVNAPDASAFGRTFELITKDDDGKMRRRTYLFDGSRVHLTGTEDHGAESRPEVASTPTATSLKITQPGWFRRQWNALKNRFSGSK